ncbi:MAG: ABC transporter permease subunit [Gemmatimonadetes bacterium]|jgi:ABC-type transport system involved in multi-copper enzyme maturation permease subunit|nr:ABC transporter permease subunit [Gemmatimonadota bacterium]MBT6150016.1 ABC transporter permease subunit [Gemmatimonadota bacterium]MBT7863288.1 ABC transporter permease subunit [Gemmatimonadota bacterium]
MLRALIIKEWLISLMELRFLVCASLCVVLGVVSVFVLRADLDARRAEFTHNQSEYRDQAREYGSYRQLQRQGMRVDRPPQSFQVLFYGVEKTLDRTAVVTDDYMPGFAGDLNTNPAVMLFPVADMLFIVAVVLSLLAFFISYDTVAGERESGTLKLLLSFPVPRDLVILAKWIGGYLSLALPFIIALLTGALLISTSAEIPFTSTDWQAFVMAGVISLLLLAVMFSIGLLVSVRSRSSSTAILTLLSLWVLLALVIPNLGPYVAEVVAPVPDVGQVEREIALRTQQISEQYRSGWGGMRRRMRGMSREERSAFFRQMREQRDKLQAEVNEATSDVIGDFEIQLRRQTDIARQLTRISPVASFVYASTDVGATGVRHEERLINSLRAYQRQFARFVTEQAGEGGSFFGGDEDYDISALPSFDYRAESLGERFESRMVDTLLLLLFAVAFFMAAFVSFLRSDIS